MSTRACLPAKQNIQNCPYLPLFFTFQNIRIKYFNIAAGSTSHEQVVVMLNIKHLAQASSRHGNFLNVTIRAPAFCTYKPAFDHLFNTSLRSPLWNV